MRENSPGEKQVEIWWMWGTVQLALGGAVCAVCMRGREWQGEVSGAVSCGQSQHCPESSREPLKMCQQERARALKNSLWLRAEDGWKGWPGQRNWGEMGAGGQVDQLQEEKQGQGRQS